MQYQLHGSAHPVQPLRRDELFRPADRHDELRRVRRRLRNELRVRVGSLSVQRAAVAMRRKLRRCAERSDELRLLREFVRPGRNVHAGHVRVRGGRISLRRSVRGHHDEPVALRPVQQPVRSRADLRRRHVHLPDGAPRMRFVVRRSHDGHDQLWHVRHDVPADGHVYRGDLPLSWNRNSVQRALHRLANRRYQLRRLRRQLRRGRSMRDGSLHVRDGVHDVRRGVCQHDVRPDELRNVRKGVPRDASVRRRRVRTVRALPRVDLPDRGVQHDELQYHGANESRRVLSVQHG